MPTDGRRLICPGRERNRGREDGWGCALRPPRGGVTLKSKAALLAAFSWIVLAPLFLEAGSLPGPIAQVVELCSADMGAPLDFDLLDAGRTKGESPFNPDAMRSGPPHGEIGVVAAFPDANDGPAKFLHPLSIAFYDSKMNTDRIARADIGQVGIHFRLN
jgi:hypothetical protein